MADFFARVELHRAQWPEDYKTLHDALSKHGFTNRIVSAVGEKRLPTGFYFSTNRIDDVQRVAKAVKACADSTGYSSEVIVIRSAQDNPWYGFLGNV
jgi:uncharacterized protein (DUF2461 family)